MGVEVTVTGTGRWAGAKSNIDAYEVIEDSTPTEASDSSGGTGQLKFKAIEDPSRFGSALLLNNDVELSDGDRGLTQGKINDITSNEGILDITADSRLGRLVIDKTAQPVHDTFANVITYYLSLGGITTGIAIDPVIGAIYVEAPGWTGDLWTKIKELCVVYGAEIALLRTNVAIRPVRQRRALEINNSSEQWVISNRELAKQVEVCYYNTEWKEDSLIYPKGGWTPDVPIYTVDAGQTITVNIPVGVSLTSITPLTPFSSMPIDYTGPSSGYCVLGNDNVIVPVADWRAGGGLINAEIGADGSSIDLTIVGAQTPYAPYRIASVDTDGTTFYSSLRIQGDGIHYERNSIIVDTAADETTTSRDVGVTVDNIFIETEAQARSLALDVASRWATPRRELRITKSAISKPGETGQDYDFATFAQFDAYAATNGIVTFANFDAAWAGDTFADFDNYWYDLVSDDFDYQVFGNVNGARVAWRRAMWRIRTATIGMDSVQYTAEEDTTIGDFDASANRTPVYSWSPVMTNLTTNPSFESVSPGATVLRTNLYPDPDFQTGAGWDTQVASWAPTTWDGLPAAIITAAASGANFLVGTLSGNLTGKRAAARFVLVATPSSAGKSLTIRWYDGTFFGGVGTIVLPAAGQSVTIDMPSDRPSVASSLRTYISRSEATGTWLAGDQFIVAQPIAQEVISSSLVVSGGFFSGSTPDALGWDYAWSGTSNNSMSTASASVTEVLRNYHANPKLAVDSTGWYQSSATSRTAVTIPDRPEILFALKSAGPISAANNRTVVATFTGLTPGDTYTATLLVRIDGDNWVYGVWDTAIAAPTPPTITSRPVAARAGWREESITFVAVSSSASVGLNANGAMSNVEYGLTGAVIVDGPIASPYFDGSNHPKVRRNLIPVPNPTVYAGSGWNVAGATSLGEWLSFTMLATTTPYIFTSRSVRDIAVGDLVTLAIDFRADALAGNGTHAAISAHKRTGNVYYGASRQVVPLTLGEVQRVVIQWVATEAIPANDLDIAVVASDATGTFQTVDPGFKWSVRNPIIEHGHTDGSFFNGSFSPEQGYGAAWDGAVQASASYLYDLDFMPAWTGTADASASVLRANPVASIAASTPAQAIRWVTSHTPYHGSRALRYRIETTSAVGLPAVDFTPPAGQVYTLLLRARANSRNQQVRPRIRSSLGDYVTLQKGVWTEVRVTTVAGGGTQAQTGLLIDSGAGQQGDDTIDIDAVVLVAGDYDGPYFDGDSADPSDTARYAWNGPAHASPSSYEIRHISGYTGMTFADFDASYAGLTFEDFALIPLPNVESQYDRF